MVMVFRALLSIWFFVTSGFAPALCCCAPFALGSPATVKTSTPLTSAAKKTCPHCKDTAPATGEAPKGKKSYPADPSRDHCPCKGCPCKDHVIASAVPDPVSVRDGVFGTWLLDFPPVAAAFAHRVSAAVESRRGDHRGPPPPAGDRLEVASMGVTMFIGDKLGRTAVVGNGD